MNSGMAKFYFIWCNDDDDVLVLRSADCWTDHKLLCGKLRLKVSNTKGTSVISKRFAASGLRDENVCERFVEKVSELVEGGWGEASGGVEVWEVIGNGW